MSLSVGMDRQLQFKIRPVFERETYSLQEKIKLPTLQQCVNLLLHMPITQSAKKALRSSDKKRVVNTRRKKNVEVAVKNVKKLASKGEKKAAQEALSLAYKALDKAVKTGLLKKNAASRKKSRLSAAIKRGNPTK